METITRDVRDLDQAERSTLERMVGHRLNVSQRVVLQVMTADVISETDAPPTSEGGVPEWWRVYEGQREEEVDRLDSAIRQRADLTRSFE